MGGHWEVVERQWEVQIAKLICLNCNIYLSKLKYVFVQIKKCICPNWQIYLPKLQHVFVDIAKCICPNYKMYLSKLESECVQIVQCICPNLQIYLSKLLNVFFQVVWIGNPRILRSVDCGLLFNDGNGHLWDTLSYCLCVKIIDLLNVPRFPSLVRPSNLFLLYFFQPWAASRLWQMWICAKVSCLANKMQMMPAQIIRE